MATDRFLIAPLEIGLERDLPPWQIPDDAYEKLENAYIFRGKIKKRFGSRYTGNTSNEILKPLYSRLRIKIGTTDGSGNFSGTVPGNIYKVGQQFSVDENVYSVSTSGLANLQVFGIGNGTYNTATGAVTISNSAPSTDVYFYPAEPVMGLALYENNSINDQTAYAFDTQFIYKYTGAYWINSYTATPFTGSNSDFFWTCNWRGSASDDVSLFATNFNTSDYMVYFDGTNWNNFRPAYLVAAGNEIITARIIIPFKNRLILLNTVESNGGVNHSFVNRCRYSHNGSPHATSAFYEPGEAGATGGGYIDAPTKEEIISVAFIKDRLIVYFERSTWELVYTANHMLPFIWQKINTELGSEGTFSSVPFDKVVLTIGTTGVHACSGVNVERIDTKIPDEVFKLVNKEEGVKRVAGIRDYYTEMVYWTFPSASNYSNSVYPDRVLVFNYNNGTWAFNDDSITTFGYLEQSKDYIWQDMSESWNELDFKWTEGVVYQQYRSVIAGNQEGFVFIIDPDKTTNEHLLVVNYVDRSATVVEGRVTLQIKEHNIKDGDYIKINTLDPNFNAPSIYKVNVVDGNTLNIYDQDLWWYVDFTGNASNWYISRVSNIKIWTKQWNPYIARGNKFFLEKVLFCVSRTDSGKITVDCIPNGSNVSTIVPDVNLGASVLDTYPYDDMMETMQDRFWHPVYFYSEGEFIQLRFYFSDVQMREESVVDSDFELEGLILYTQPTGVL